ncbi:MAG: TIGR04282 family arsenosugar biosynthesis glycosyltransferase [Pseudomonadota bacterium]
MKRHLVVMVKEPRPGRVKTRLGQSIGYTQAAWWFRHQTKRLLRELGNDPRWTTVLAVSPDHDGIGSRVWPSAMVRWPQGTGNLGDRMKTVFRRGCAFGPTLVIGADIPGIQKSDIAEGFKVLANHDVVFGRAPDGGYWLIGLRGGPTPIPQNLFKNVRWSTEHALKDTIASLGASFDPERIGYVRTHQDVDTVEDLKKI